VLRAGEGASSPLILFNRTCHLRDPPANFPSPRARSSAMCPYREKLQLAQMLRAGRHGTGASHSRSAPNFFRACSWLVDAGCWTRAQWSEVSLICTVPVPGLARPGHCLSTVPLSDPPLPPRIALLSFIGSRSLDRPAIAFELAPYSTFVRRPGRRRIYLTYPILACPFLP